MSSLLTTLTLLATLAILKAPAEERFERQTAALPSSALLHPSAASVTLCAILCGLQPDCQALVWKTDCSLFGDAESAESAVRQVQLYRRMITDAEELSKEEPEGQGLEGIGGESTDEGRTVHGIEKTPSSDGLDEAGESADGLVGEAGPAHVMTRGRAPVRGHGTGTRTKKPPAQDIQPTESTATNIHSMREGLTKWVVDTGTEDQETTVTEMQTTTDIEDRDDVTTISQTAVVLSTTEAEEFLTSTTASTSITLPSTITTITTTTTTTTTTSVTYGSTVDDRYYWRVVSPEPVTYDDARSFCGSLRPGGDLANVYTKEQLQFLWEDPGRPDVQEWIGIKLGGFGFVYNTDGTRLPLDISHLTEGTGNRFTLMADLVRGKLLRVEGPSPFSSTSGTTLAAMVCDVPASTAWL